MRIKQSDTYTIGKQLKILMAIMELKTSELAKALGMDVKRFSNILCSNKSPNLDELVKISRYFGVTTDFLLGFNGVITIDMNSNLKRTYYPFPTVNIDISDLANPHNCCDRSRGKQVL